MNRALRIVCSIMFIVAGAAKAQAQCSVSIQRLPDPVDGGYAYRSVATCNQPVSSMALGVGGWPGFALRGGLVNCFDTSVCEYVDTFICASQGVHSLTPTLHLNGSIIAGTPDVRPVTGLATVSADFRQAATIGSARIVLTYDVPQHIFPRNLQVYVGGERIDSGTLPTLTGTWEVPRDVPEGTSFDVIPTGLCNADSGVALHSTVILPNSIDFNVTNASPEYERRIILSNVDHSYEYPHFQSIGAEDASVPMHLRVRDGAGQFQSGRTVYVRLVDPPDPSSYAKNRVSAVGDNVGTAAVLSSPDLEPTTLPGIYQGISGANGIVQFKLQLLPGTAAGNNYEVEASFHSDFPSSSTFKSGTLTAWKRILVEKSEMLRNGIFLSRDAQPGDSVIYVADNRYGGNQGRGRISRGDRIILVHAPAYDGRNAADGAYSEARSVAEVVDLRNGEFSVTLGTRNGNRTTLDPLVGFYGPDPSPGVDRRLGDAIAQLQGGSVGPGDTFDAPVDLLTGSLFQDAFCEILVLPDHPSGYVPMPRFGTYDQQILQQFSDKWTAYGSGTPDGLNRMHLLIADSDMQQPTQAAGVMVNSVPDHRSSWVWRGTIERQNRNAATGERYAAKTAAHEIAHQFETNDPFVRLDHCPPLTLIHDNPRAYCLLSAPDSNGLVEAQYGNGIVGFHMLQLGQEWHSEFFGIRQHTDPFRP